MTRHPRQRPGATRVTRAADPRIEAAVKEMLDRYPHLQVTGESEKVEGSEDSFAEEALELFKKRMTGS
jgi:hypothetical protein